MQKFRISPGSISRSSFCGKLSDLWCSWLNQILKQRISQQGQMMCDFTLCSFWAASPWPLLVRGPVSFHWRFWFSIFGLPVVPAGSSLYRSATDYTPKIPEEMGFFPLWGAGSVCKTDCDGKGIVQKWSWPLTPPLGCVFLARESQSSLTGEKLALL